MVHHYRYYAALLALVVGVSEDSRHSPENAHPETLHSTVEVRKGRGSGATHSTTVSLLQIFSLQTKLLVSSFNFTNKQQFLTIKSHSFSIMGDF